MPCEYLATQAMTDLSGNWVELLDRLQAAIASCATGPCPILAGYHLKVAKVLTGVLQYFLRSKIRRTVLPVVVKIERGVASARRTASASLGIASSRQRTRRVREVLARSHPSDCSRGVQYDFHGNANYAHEGVRAYCAEAATTRDELIQAHGCVYAPIL